MATRRKIAPRKVEAEAPPVEAVAAQVLAEDKPGNGAAAVPTAEAAPDQAPAAETAQETRTAGERGIQGGKVERIAVNALDFDDETYRFRAALRIGDLTRSLAAEGQQIPIILRGRKRGQQRYQIISGFRRAAAAKKLDWPYIAAIVRDDLDEEGAFRASVLENVARKSYSDIDRAVVIRTYETRGYKSTEVADLLGLSKRQKNNLRSLLELPKEVQEAIDDPDQNFGATHALLLKRLQGTRYPQLEYGMWIKATNEENLSVAQLVRAVNEEYRKGERPRFDSLFNPRNTDWGKGEVRFKPVKLNIPTMTADEKKRLKGELQQVMDRL